MKKFKTISIICMVLMLLLVIGCILSFAVLLSAGIKQELLASNSNEPNQSTDNLPTIELQETFDYGDGYLKSIVFISDKTTAPLRDTVIGSDQVWTGAGGSLALDYNLPSVSVEYSENGEAATIPNAVKMQKPKYIIITLGIDNGVGSCSEQKFKEYYSRLIDAIKESSPDSKIILQSILPISKAAEKKDPSLSIKRIANANDWINDICKTSNTRYLNSFTALCGNDGYLKSEYDSGDGIVLNADGYNALIEYIRTHGYK